MKKEINLVPQDFDFGFAKLHYRGWILFFFLCAFLWLSGLFFAYDFMMPYTSRFFFAFSIIPFFEIVLVLKNGIWERNNKTWQCVYRGSWNWLLFWSFFFFPIAILLFFLKKPLWVGEDISENKLLTNQDT